MQTALVTRQPISEIRALNAADFNTLLEVLKEQNGG